MSDDARSEDGEPSNRSSNKAKVTREAPDDDQGSSKVTRGRVAAQSQFQVCSPSRTMPIQFVTLRSADERDGRRGLPNSARLSNSVRSNSSRLQGRASCKVRRVPTQLKPDEAFKQAQTTPQGQVHLTGSDL